MNGTGVEPRARRWSGTNADNSGELDAKAGFGRSFLLRLWSSSDRGNSVWQASLEDPHTGERVGFASLEHLFAYLMELAEGNSRHTSGPIANRTEGDGG